MNEKLIQAVIDAWVVEGKAERPKTLSDSDLSRPTTEADGVAVARKQRSTDDSIAEFPLRKEERVEVANRMLEAIASCGRKFFYHEGRVSRFEVDDRGRIWYVDSYRERRIYTHYKYRWRGFTEGGTLRALVERLRDFIGKGALLPAGVFGPWPEWVCGGDLWGYSEDMQKVRDAAAACGITAAPARDAETMAAG